MPGTQLAPLSFNLPATIGKQELLGFSLLGLSILQNRFVKIGRFVEKRMAKRDEDAAQEMVDRMRADVPFDRGDLFNGIRAWQEDDAWIVQASGVRVTKSGKEQEDHAGFVEHGTAAGERGRKISYVADSNYHSLSANISDGSVRSTGRTSRRSRLQYREHPGTPAQPFFYDNVRDVLEERGADADQILGEALNEDDE